MDKYIDKHESNKEIEIAREDLPGAAIDAADDNKDTSCLEKQRTRILNNNPRNNDL